MLLKLGFSNLKVSSATKRWFASRLLRTTASDESVDYNGNCIEEVDKPNNTNFPIHSNFVDFKRNTDYFLRRLFSEFILNHSFLFSLDKRSSINDIILFNGREYMVL